MQIVHNCLTLPKFYHFLVGQTAFFFSFHDFGITLLFIFFEDTLNRITYSIFSLYVNRSFSVGLDPPT